MNRKKFKTIQNIAAQHIGRKAAKQQFSSKPHFDRVGGAWIHVPTATLFVL